MSILLISVLIFSNTSGFYFIFELVQRPMVVFFKACAIATWAPRTRISDLPKTAKDLVRFFSFLFAENNLTEIGIVSVDFEACLRL